MRCSPRTSAAPHRSPRWTASETEAPQPSASGELQPVAIRRGTGRSAAAEDLPNRRTYDPTTEDLAELRKALAEHLPRVRSRRQRPARRGHLDLRSTLRHATRTGEITHLARRGRPHRPRRLLILVDVSGSLRDHTPDYLRFAWAAQAETFTFGTRLTRITKELRHRDVDAALADAARRDPRRRRRHAHRRRAGRVPRHAALRRPRPRRADDRALRRARARRPGAR